MPLMMTLHLLIIFVWLNQSISIHVSLDYTTGSRMILPLCQHNPKELGLKTNRSYGSIRNPGYNHNKTNRSHGSIRNPGYNHNKTNRSHGSIRNPGYNHNKTNRSHGSIRNPGYNHNKTNRSHGSIRNPGYNHNKTKQFKAICIFHGIYTHCESRHDANFVDIHSVRVVVMLTLSSLVALEVVIMAYSSATSDAKVGIVTAFTECMSTKLASWQLSVFKCTICSWKRPQKFVMEMRLSGLIPCGRL